MPARYRYTVPDSAGVVHKVKDARNKTHAMSGVPGAVSARRGWARAPGPQTSEPCTARVNALVPEALREAVQTRARAEGIRLSEAIRQALEEWAASGA